MKALTPGRHGLQRHSSDARAAAVRPGEHVLVVVPDDTRSMPMPVVFDAL
jgi:hypothetical protein